MIKLISSDMDGTLLDSYRQITQVNIDAIRTLQDSGVEFIINTGREYQNVTDILGKAGLECDMICSNGSCGYDKEGNLLFEHSIPADTVKQILGVFHKSSLVPTPFSQMGRISLLSREELKKYTKEVMIPSMQINHPDFVYTDEEFEDLISQVTYVEGEAGLFDSEHRVLKFISQSTDPEALLRLRAELEQIPGLAVVSTAPTDIEITSSEAQKGIGLMDYGKGWFRMRSLPSETAKMTIPCSPFREFIPLLWQMPQKPSKISVSIRPVPTQKMALPTSSAAFSQTAIILN